MQPICFAVNDRPYCIWVSDAKLRSLEFLGRLNPQYFDYIAEINSVELAGENKHFSALSLRTAYHHALETLFAYLSATIQAPDCPYGFIINYKNDDLRKIVGKINTGENILTKFRVQKISWKRIAEVVLRNMIIDSEEKKAEIVIGFGQMWERLSHEFLNTNANSEYNSIKHGIRCNMGGVRISLGRQEKFGVECPESEMIDIGGSDYGTTTFELISVPNGKHNFCLKKRTINWSPRNMMAGLKLISMSLYDVISFMKICAGEKAEKVQFVWPDPMEVFSLPWAETPGVTELVVNDVATTDVIPFSKNKILSVYSRTDKPDETT